MCMSPHEMSSKDLEELAAYWNERADQATKDDFRRYARRQAENFEKILKERAEAGTYNDDFTDRSGSATARQGRASR